MKLRAALYPSRIQARESTGDVDAMNDFNKTQLGSPVVDPNKTQLGAPIDPNRTVMGSPSFEATVTIKPIQCPVCKSFNPAGLMFCIECGLIFEMALDGDAFGAPTVQLPVLVADGREFVLRPGANVIGRQGDIAIEDTRVSRRHAEVLVESTGVMVSDLGSTNGTMVGTTRVMPGQKQSLVNGERVSFGGFEMTLSLPGEANKTLAGLGGKTTSLSVPPTLSDTVAWLCFNETEIPLKKGVMSFGRKDGNDIVVPDPYVSGKHGEFEITEEAVFICDTGSTNGTVVNDAKLTPQQKTALTKDDIVKLGQLELRVKFEK